MPRMIAAVICVGAMFTLAGACMTLWPQIERLWIAPAPGGITVGGTLP